MPPDVSMMALILYFATFYIEFQSSIFNITELGDDSANINSNRCIMTIHANRVTYAVIYVMRYMEMELY